MRARWIFWLCFGTAALGVALWLTRPLERSVIEAQAWEDIAATGVTRVLVVFDITGDDRFHTLPLAERHAQVAARTARLLQRLPGRPQVLHAYHYSRAVLLEVNRRALRRLQHHPDVAALRHHPSAGPATPRTAQARPPDATPPDGFKLAIIDTGLATRHPRIAPFAVTEACFCSSTTQGSCCPDGNHRQFGPGAATDQHGHGSSVTGLALDVFTRFTRADDIGADRPLQVVAVKISDDGPLCCVADLIAALDWLAAQHPDTRVINISIATGPRFADACDHAGNWLPALRDALSAVQANGTLVVAASGNDGQPDGLPPPACFSDTLAVGAVYLEDYAEPPIDEPGCVDQPMTHNRVTCFSNAGSQLDLLAPGAFLSGIGAAGHDRDRELKGTSFASPQVAGCALALRWHHPELQPAAIRKLLLHSRTHIRDHRNDGQWPLLDCAHALARARQTATAHN